MRLDRSAVARGFTLIELIVVIVILGILAATALPKFIDLSADARYASLQAMGGAVKTAVGLASGAWAGRGASGTSVTMADGTVVTVSGTTGYPAASLAGIGAAVSNCTSLANCNGFTLTPGAIIATLRLNGAPATCQISYNAVSGVATVAASGSC
jgi:MSHA pilin protein MshA